MADTGLDETLAAGAEGGATPPPVIRLDNVAKRFGDFVAVESAHFDIGEGEFFSMLGPSGCGKTTTLRMIAGFEQPTAGRILLDGEDVSTTPPYKRNVNTVFQNYALFPHMSVFDNIAFGLRNSKVPDAEVTKRVNELLEIVRLPEFAKRRPNQLSGGQQQRIALARALVNLPKALLLDEPLGALDLKLREAMQDELKALQQRLGITFVFVTHDQHEALSMADQLAVFNQGKIVQIGAPQDIYARPRTRFVADFVGSSNVLPPSLTKALGGPASWSSLRPEDVALVEPDKGAASGSVVAVRYLGAGSRVTLLIGDTEVAALVGSKETVPDIGGMLGIAFAPDALHVMEGA